MLIYEGLFTPSVWVSGEDSVTTPILRSLGVSVVVRCLLGPERHTRKEMEDAGVSFVSGAFFAGPPGKCHTVGIAVMCSEIDHHRGKHGAVMFYCRHGKHRSFAAAVAYVLWLCRAAELDAVVSHAKSVNDRFELLDSVQERKGKPRRALGLDLRQWQYELSLCRPHAS